MAKGTGEETTAAGTTTAKAPARKKAAAAASAASATPDAGVTPDAGAASNFSIAGVIALVTGFVKKLVGKGDDSQDAGAAKVVGDVKKKAQDLLNTDGDSPEGAIGTARGKIQELMQGEGKSGMLEKGGLVAGGLVAADGFRRMVKKDADGKRNIKSGVGEVVAGAGFVGLVLAKRAAAAKAGAEDKGPSVG